MRRYILTLKCPDRPGIINSLTGALLEAKGNVVESAQFGDELTGTFTMRTVFDTPVEEQQTIERLLQPVAGNFDATITLRPQDHHRRALIMVSKYDHCLLDLLYRHRYGELPLEIPLIVSNHPDCAELAERYDIPYLVIPVGPGNKAEAEARLLDLVDEHSVDFVVLARYMQILSEDVCNRLPGRIINIHHSFLPGFKGSRPYHQAYERGVKLIGATAHYVTTDLDEGPIISQEVAYVNHSQDADDLVRVGRDIERMVLAQAVRFHSEDRVLLIGQRTVVFS
jgi:formyltetrahydrofolate deformylase